MVVYRCLLFSFILMTSVFCSASPIPRVSPIPLHANSRCAACGMVVMNFAGPHAQIIWNNGQVDFYGNLQEAMSVLLDQKNQATIAAVYVQHFDHLAWDSYHGHWMLAENAYYVIDSPHKHAAMGVSYTPFKAKVNAEQFQRINGGTVVTYAELLSHVMVHANAVQAGHWMFGLDYMYMPMSGLLSGTGPVYPQPGMSRSGYMSIPQSMSMHMLMINVMYMTPHWHMMLMGNYLFKNMSSIMFMHGMSSNMFMHTQGFGDTQLMAGAVMYNVSNKELTLNAGVSLPTGAINQRGDMGLYGYPMQLGSGTVDPMLDVMYRYFVQAWTWRAEAKTLFRVYKNSHHYALGDAYEIDAGGMYTFNNRFNTYVTLQGLWWGKVRGQDPGLNPSRSPTTDPNAQGGRLLNSIVGIQWLGKGVFSGQSLSLDWSVPLVQSLNGPQLKRNWSLGLRWGWMYG